MTAICPAAAEAPTLTERCAPIASRAVRWLGRASLVVAAMWLVAIACALYLRPAMTNDSFFARHYGFALFHVLTFRFHAGAVFLSAAAVFAIVRRGRVASALALAGLIGISPEAVHAWPRIGDARHGTPVRVMSLNNKKYDWNVDRVVAAVRANAPDLLALEELSPEMDARLAAALAEAYPHRMTFPSQPSLGIGLYSKWPLQPAVTPETHAQFPRVMAADATVAGQSFRVFVIHPPSPHSAWRVARNRKTVDAIIGQVRAADRPTVIVGDCNFPFESQQTDALRAAGLAHVDDRAGWGLRWSWTPADLWPVTRIDHAFVTSHWGVTDSRVLPDVGSDHRPILVDLRLR